MTRIAASLAAVVALAALSACSPDSDADGASPAPSALVSSEAYPREAPASETAPIAATASDDPCGAGKVAPWIGEDSTVPVRRAVVAAAGPGSDRWIYPDSTITEDHRPDRLNVVMARGTDVIVSAHCG